MARLARTSLRRPRQSYEIIVPGNQKFDPLSNQPFEAWLPFKDWAGGGGLHELPDGMNSTLQHRVSGIWRTFSHAIPSDRALAVIARYGPILEVGSGTGYWAAHLKARNVDIMATDINPAATGDNAHHDKVQYCEIVQKDGIRVVEDHRDGRALLLCWPPYQHPLALRCIQAHRGTVIYIGEWYGRTATEEFHDELKKHWIEEARIPIPQWPGWRDDLRVFKRRK